MGGLVGDFQAYRKRVSAVFQRRYHATIFIHVDAHRTGKRKLQFELADFRNIGCRGNGNQNAY